jgi:hypothetical protein
MVQSLKIHKWFNFKLKINKTGTNFFLEIQSIYWFSIQSYLDLVLVLVAIVLLLVVTTAIYLNYHFRIYFMLIAWSVDCMMFEPILFETYYLVLQSN